MGRVRPEGEHHPRRAVSAPRHPLQQGAEAWKPGSPRGASSSSCPVVTTVIKTIIPAINSGSRFPRARAACALHAAVFSPPNFKSALAPRREAPVPKAGCTAR